MKISIVIMFKSNEKYIKNFFSKIWEYIEKKLSHIEFEYFILENNSTDNTKNELIKFSKNRNCKLFLRNFNFNLNFKKGISIQRGIYMGFLRNLLKSYSKKLDSDYTILIDSDILFNEKTIISLLLILQQHNKNSYDISI